MSSPEGLDQPWTMVALMSTRWKARWASARLRCAQRADIWPRPPM